MAGSPIPKCVPNSSIFFYVGFVLSALALNAPAIAQECSPYSTPPNIWPESNSSEWVALKGRSGSFATDVASDVIQDIFDAVGGVTHPSEAAGFLALSPETVYFRIRLAESPAEELSDKWKTFSLHTLIESDADTNDGSWDINVVFEGPMEEVSIRVNDLANSNWCMDSAETTPCLYPAEVDNSGPDRFSGFARVDPACSSFGSGEDCNAAECKNDSDVDGMWDGHTTCTDQFLTIQVPRPDLLNITGLYDLDLAPMIMGTSSNGSQLNKDVMGAACSDTWHAVLPTCNVNIVSGFTESLDKTHEACEILVLGPDLIAADGSNFSAKSGLRINFLPGFRVEQGATLNANACGQSLCMTSPIPMPNGCHSCIDEICGDNPNCCESAFDQECVDMVGTVCGLLCK